MAKRDVLLGLSIGIVALLVGAGIGFAVGWRMGVRSGPVFDLLSAVQFGSYVSAVRANGTDRAYEDALRSSVTLNAQLKARDTEPSNHRMYDLDSAVTLARLSELKEKRGASDQAKQVGSEAEKLCPATGIRDCSLGKLLEIARYIDGDKSRDAKP